MEQRVLACVADSVRAECVAPKEPVIVGCGTGRLNRGEHHGSRCVHQAHVPGDELSVCRAKGRRSEE